MHTTVLVTGAFGSLGAGVVKQLVAASHRVVALDLPTRRNRAMAGRLGAGIQVLWGNVCDPGVWPRALAGVDAVVHLAAIIPPAVDRNPALATTVNQTATLELVRQMEASPGARRLVFASSMGVAGIDQQHRSPPLRADEPPQPADRYGRTKVACEQCIRDSALSWTILRIAAIAALPSGAMSFQSLGDLDFIFDFSAGGRIEVVHPDDAALAFANAVSCDAAIGRTLFVGGGPSCQATVIDFFNRLLVTAGLAPLRAEVFRPGPPHFFGDWLDTADSERLLAFQRHGLDDIIRELRARVGHRRALLKLAAPLVRWLIERRSPHRARVAGRPASAPR